MDSTDKDKAAFKSWLAWYSSPPENWNQKYGDAFVWTAQEKALKPNSRRRTHEAPVLLLPEMRRTYRLVGSGYAVSQMQGEHMKARQVFTALMTGKGYTEEDMKMDKGRYVNAAMQGRWSYFLAGWEMRGVM